MTAEQVGWWEVMHVYKMNSCTSNSDTNVCELFWKLFALHVLKDHVMVGVGDIHHGPSTRNEWHKANMSKTNHPLEDMQQDT